MSHVTHENATCIHARRQPELPTCHHAQPSYKAITQKGAYGSHSVNTLQDIAYIVPGTSLFASSPFIDLLCSAELMLLYVIFFLVQ